MKRVPILFASWLIAALTALALAACERVDDRIKAGQDQPTSPQASASTPAPPAPPSQADTRTDANASETAKASDAPMKPMTKDEEDKAMPQPGQNNDHSTVAQDPKLSTEKQ